MENDVELTRKCLTLIGRIAVRGACSPDAQEVADTLMELTCALVERRQMRDLDRMHRDLDFIDSTSRGFTARDMLKFALQSTWN